MRVMRIVASAIVVMVAGWALNRECLRPFRCNRDRLIAQRSVDRAFEVRYNPADIAQTMRMHQRVLRACLECTSQDVALHMQLAALQRFIGRNDDAEQTYLNALRYDERPELYFNLGEAQLAQKKEKEAIASFAHAAVFNPYNLQHLDLGIREKVEAEIQRNYPWIEPLFPAKRSW